MVKNSKTLGQFLFALSVGSILVARVGAYSRLGAYFGVRCLIK